MRYSPPGWHEIDRFDKQHLISRKKRIFDREKVVDGDFDGKIQANVKNKQEIHQCKSPVVVWKRQFRKWYIKWRL